MKRVYTVFARKVKSVFSATTKDCNIGDYKLAFVQYATIPYGVAKVISLDSSENHEIVEVFE